MKKFLLPISVMLISAVALYAFVLNGDYYKMYFFDSGYPGNMPAKMAIFFIVTEMILWSFSSSKNAVSISMKYGLVLFSIFATLSSQYTSTSELEAESAQIVYEKIDNSAEIKRYEAQILKQDERIDAIFEERKEKDYYGLTDEPLEFAQAEKARYEGLLKGLKAENKTEVEEIYTVSSIYGWFSYDLPRIFRSGVTEEFIRILFQLFSSIILASVAPMCITIVRGMILKPSAPPAVSEVLEPEEYIPELKKPALHNVKWPRPEKTPITMLTSPEKSDILRMMYWYKSKDTGPILPPGKTSEAFAKMYKGKAGRVYTVEECQAVWDEICDRGMQDSDIKIIREEMGL